MRVRCAVKFGYKKAPDYTEAGLLVGFGLLPFASCKVRIGCIVILFHWYTLSDPGIWR